VREGFHDQLREVRDELADLAAMAGTALRHATRALLEVDLGLAEQVLEADTKMNRTRDQCEHLCHSLLALQAPVAGDLRMIVAAAYCANRLERMGDLAGHVAGVTRRSHPTPAVPAGMRHYFADMGDRAACMADQVGQLILRPRADGCAELIRADEGVDAAHAAAMAEITAPTWPHGVPIATNLALLCRFYERFADQAVSVARHLEFVSTGTLPSF
jgi:phosphate transport system protein